ncbi:hypothetical protein P12x_003731 [Tundrisphaera lichenicola]|uniref:hypothetical protein n=1 Tax=Tundrisphaera lichenicola TaxID=2029860 RepID=UPI003EBF9F36
MRLPRIRLSIRRMMAVVALAALGLVYVFPECQRLLWHYRHPEGVSMFGASVLVRPASSDTFPNYPARQPIRMQEDSTSDPAQWLPAGLWFRVDVVVRVTDPTNFAKVYQEQRRSRWVRSGEVGSAGHRGTDIFEMTPPKVGSYALRFEQEMSDVFGRTGSNGLATTFINVN